MPNTTTCTPRTILVYVGTDLVGDALLKLPFLQEIKSMWPHAKVTWVAGHNSTVFNSILKPLGDLYIDDIVEKANLGVSPWELLRSPPFKGQHFDLIIDTQRRATTSLILKRISHTWFISGAAKYMLSSLKPRKKQKFPHMTENMMALLELATGRHVQKPYAITLPTMPAYDDAAATILPAAQRAAYTAVVGLAPGAGGRHKCWPLPHFIACATKLCTHNILPAFLLGPAETDDIATLKDAVPGAIFPLQSDAAQNSFGYDPVLTIALGKHLDMAVCNDAGTGHMMAASGCPLLSLFGPTSPKKFAPISPNFTVLQAQSFAPEGAVNTADMTHIPVSAVCDVIHSTLTQSDYMPS